MRYPTAGRNACRRATRAGAWVAGVAVALLLALAPAAHAQNTLTLHGTVTSGGKGLQGAQVAVKSTETGRQRGALTNAAGAYTVVGLPPGKYNVQVQMLGYGTQERNVELLVGQRPTLDFDLQQGAVEIAAVVAESKREPTFEVQRNDVSIPVVQAEIVNLPLNTRNTINLAAIVPGMKTYAPTAGRSLPASGSLPDLRFWNFYLDGAEWKSFFNGNLVGIPQTGSPIPQEAMKEFRVHLNPYDAQYTRGASFIISAVSQRGTNDWHGSVFGYGQNNSLKALDMFQRQSKAANPSAFSRPDYSRAQAGVNIRGPIVKDKAFFSLSYEYQNTADNISVVPGKPAFNPALWNAFAGNYAAPTKNQNWVTRFTVPQGKNHTFDLTWAGRVYNSETNFGGTGARNSGIFAKYQVHSGQLRDTWTPNDKMVNELSFNILYWHHDESPLQPGPTFNYPSITFGTSGFPLELKETHLRLMDHATYSAAGGKHLLTFGAELAKVHTDSWNPSNVDGSFTFKTDTSSLPLTGRIGIGVLTGSTEDARAATSGWSTGAYFQDQWQMTRNFQLTLGLRYDAEINTLANDFHSPFAKDPVLTAIPMLQPFLNDGNRKNDMDNIAPRMSFSWDAFGNGKTFIRGGAGIMYDRIATFMAFFEKQTAGWRTFDFTNPGTKDPAALRQMVASGAGSSTPAINLLRTDMQTPKNYQASIGFGQTLAPGFALNVDYIHQDARNLYVTVSPNYVNTLTNHRNLTDKYGTITLYDDFGRARFDAVVSNLTYDKPGTRLSAAYTLGFIKSEYEGLGGYIDQSFFVMQPTTGDERHRLVLSGLKDLPYGFKVSAVGIFATPRPYVATVGQDVNHDQSFTDDFLNGNAQRVIRPSTTWKNMYRTVDMRVSKGFTYGGKTIAVSAEAFNIFNWDNLAGFFGRQKDAAGTPLTSYGTANGVYAARQGQIGIRYEF